MPVLALIAAASLVAAEWKTPVVTDDDYPSTALLKQKSAATMLDVVIDPQGNVVSCSESGSVGDAQLAAQMCKIAKRKNASPARDASGKPTFGFRHDFAALSLPGTYQADQIGNIGPAPDVDIEVASIPAGTASPLLVDLTIAVDRAGKPTGCDYGKAGAAGAFGKVACDQVAQMEFDKLTDAGGGPISYVRALSVRFTLGGKAGG